VAHPDVLVALQDGPPDVYAIDAGVARQIIADIVIRGNENRY
jgi:hypothetical protein